VQGSLGESAGASLPRFVCKCDVRSVRRVGLPHCRGPFIFIKSNEGLARAMIAYRVCMTNCTEVPDVCLKLSGHTFGRG
jgi:hypothetical protein